MSDVIVCAQTVDQPNPVPGATIAWCDLCAEEVWLSPTSKRHFDAGTASTIRCFECAMGTIEPDAHFAVFPEQRNTPLAALAADLDRYVHDDRKTQT